MAEIFDMAREPFSLADLARYRRARDEGEDLDLLTSLLLAEAPDVPPPPDLSRYNLAQYAPDPIGAFLSGFEETQREQRRPERSWWRQLFQLGSPSGYSGGGLVSTWPIPGVEAP